MMLSCTFCNQDPADLDYNLSAGHITCKNCGIIVQDYYFDESAARRTFAGDDGTQDDPSQNGAFQLLGSRLETSIVHVPSRNGAKLSRAHQQATTDKETEHLRTANGRVYQLCDALRLQGPVVETAKDIYKRYHGSKEMKRVRNEQVVMSACIYFACRSQSVHRSILEMCKDLSIEQKNMNKAVYALGRLLKTAVASQEGTSMASQESSKPSALVERACNRLGWSQINGLRARRIAIEIEEQGAAAGRRPCNIAGACILFAATAGSEKNVSAKAVADALATTQAAIKTVHKLLLPTFAGIEERNGLYGAKI